MDLVIADEPLTQRLSVKAFRSHLTLVMGGLQCQLHFKAAIA